MLTTVTTVSYYTTDSTAVATTTDSTDVVSTAVSTEIDYTTISTALAVVVDSTATVLTTASTETDLVTVTTEIVVVPAATTTVLTTTETATDLYTLSTYEPTVTLATATVVVTGATITPTCANPMPTFAIQVVGGAYNNEYLNTKLTPAVGCQGTVGNEQCDFVGVSSSITAASIFTLNGGVLSDYNGYELATVPEPDSVDANFISPANVAGGIERPFSCSISSNGQLLCSSGYSNLAEFCGIQLIYADEESYFGSYCTPITLNVVPLCIVP